MRWIMPTKITSLVGSTQNQVPRRSRPAHRSLAFERAGRTRIVDHLEVETEADGFVEPRTVDAVVPRPGSLSTACSCPSFDRRRRKDAHAVQFALVDQHLREARIVTGRPDEPAATGLHRGRLEIRRHVEAEQFQASSIFPVF